MPFPLGNFVWASVEDKNVYNGSLSKQNDSLEKKSPPPPTMDSGIPLCPPNYTKNRKVRDLLDTPDPKDKLPTVQMQSLRPLKAGVQLISTEKSE